MYALINLCIRYKQTLSTYRNCNCYLFAHEIDLKIEHCNHLTLQLSDNGRRYRDSIIVLCCCDFYLVLLLLGNPSPSLHALAFILLFLSVLVLHASLAGSGLGSFTANQLSAIKKMQ